MILTLALALLLQSDFAQQLDQAVARLDSDDAQARDLARTELLKLARSNPPEARRFLDAKLEGAQGEVKAILEQILGDATLDAVKMEIVWPKEAVTLKEVNARDFKFKIRITNGCVADITLFRNWAVNILDPAGGRLRPNLRLGRWGHRPPGCFLAVHNPFFVAVPAGKSVEIEEGIACYMGDATHLVGYELSATGSFTLQLSYSFDRQAFKAMCTEGCADHDGRGQPWNRALEGRKSFDAKFVIRDTTEEENRKAAERAKWLDEIVRKAKSGEIKEEEFRKALDEMTSEEQAAVMKKVLGVEK